MAAFLGGLDRQGRAALGVLLGGVAVLLGAVLTWFETQPTSGHAVVIDEAGVRVLVGLGAVLVALGAALIPPGPRRRWWPGALVLAAIGFAGVLANWVILLIGVDAWRVPSADPAPEPDRYVVGLPLCLVGCGVAAVAALLIWRWAPVRDKKQP